VLPVSQIRNGETGGAAKEEFNFRHGGIMQGPNVKKLIVHKMSLIMVPSGCGDGKGKALATAIGALTKPGNLVAVAREATAWVEQAIATVRTAPDSPYKTDEEIAGAILEEVERRKGPK
jgi:hypothetical protein